MDGCRDQLNSNDRYGNRPRATHGVLRAGPCGVRGRRRCLVRQLHPEDPTVNGKGHDSSPRAGRTGRTGRAHHPRNSDYDAKLRQRWFQQRFRGRRGWRRVRHRRLRPAASLPSRPGPRWPARAVTRLFAPLWKMQVERVWRFNKRGQVVDLL